MNTDKLFTGQREVTGLGIYHYGARFYSPKLGRFLSADTIVPNSANPQDFNRYSYVRNNPTRYVDPTGHVCSDPDDPTPTCTSGRPYPNNAWSATRTNPIQLGCIRNCGGGRTGGGGGGGPVVNPPVIIPLEDGLVIGDPTPAASVIAPNPGGGHPQPSLDTSNSDEPILCNALANGYPCEDASLTSYETLSLVGNLAGGAAVEAALAGVFGIASFFLSRIPHPVAQGMAATAALVAAALTVDAAFTGFLATEIWLGMNPDLANGETQIAIIFDGSFPDVVEYGGNYQPHDSYGFLGTAILHNFLEDH